MAFFILIIKIFSYYVKNYSSGYTDRSQGFRAIERGDVEWFSHTALTQDELNYLLLYCAYREINAELVKSIIQAGAHNLAQACAHALSYENCPVAHCLIEYWQTHRMDKPDVNINTPSSYCDNSPT
jgi:hypothetical protein